MCIGKALFYLISLLFLITSCAKVERIERASIDDAFFMGDTAIAYFLTQSVTEEGGDGFTSTGPGLVSRTQTLKIFRLSDTAHTTVKEFNYPDAGEISMQGYTPPLFIYTQVSELGYALHTENLSSGTDLVKSLIGDNAVPLSFSLSQDMQYFSAQNQIFFTTNYAEVPDMSLSEAFPIVFFHPGHQNYLVMSIQEGNSFASLFIFNKTDASLTATQFSGQLGSVGLYDNRETIIVKYGFSTLTQYYYLPVSDFLNGSYTFASIGEISYNHIFADVDIAGQKILLINASLDPGTNTQVPELLIHDFNGNLIQSIKSESG